MRSTSSLTVFAGTAGLTVSTVVEATASVTGSKFLMGSYGTREQRRVDHMGAERKQDGVAVGRCLRYLAGSEIAARASAVLNIDLLAELLSQLLRHDPREGVGHTTGRKCNHRPHRPRWIGLRPSQARHGRQRGSACCQMQKLSAGKFHFAPPTRFTNGPMRTDRTGIPHRRDWPRRRLAFLPPSQPFC